MIEEQFVSFDTAKMLKEAGFDVLCHNYYDKDGFFRGEFKAYMCPTQALAARWLREAHGIHVFSFFQYHTQRWVYYVANLSAPCAEIGMIFSENDYDNYENAMEDGLHEAIKLIKKQGL